MSQPYNSFGSYVRKRFGSPVFKTNIDAGFTCPNRDGTVATGGCTYCNNESFKPGACRPTLSVQEQVQNGIEYMGGRYGAKKFIAYFQAYTNTHAPVDHLRRLYTEALADPSVIGLAIGTRPDAMDAAKLDLLEEIARTHFVLVEYGLQSIHEATLKYINRGHDYQCFLDTVAATLKRPGLHVGGHLIVGFPTETRQQTLAMAEAMNQCGLEFLKIHQLQIIKDTPMAAEFAAHPFPVFEYEEYINFLAEFIDRLSPHIVLQRLFATAPDEILIAPKWGRSRHEILSDITARFRTLGTRQGRACSTCTTASLQDKI